MRSIIIAACLAALAASAQAELFNGTMLLERLRGTPEQQHLAAGYIIGVADSHYKTGYCPPDSVNAKGIIDIVQAYLVAYPARRAETGDIVVISVLRAAWPCAAPTPARTAPKSFKHTI